VDPAARPLPQRGFNRWTLEPVLFLIPLFLLAIVLYATLLAVFGSGDFVGLAAAVLLAALILALSVLGFRRKR
jgi:hypothetical protein